MIRKKEEWIKVDNSQGYSCITIAGDTYFGEWYTDRRKAVGKPDALQKYGYEYSFEKVAPLLNESDYNIVNFEAVLTNEKESIYTGKLPFVLYANPEETIRELKHRNINAVILGNNHCSDFGAKIGMESFSTFVTNGFNTIGYGKNLKEAVEPLLLDCESKKVIIFNGYWFKKWRLPFKHYATEDMPGVAAISDEMFDEIRKYREKYPEAFIIMSPHWGNDFAYPDDEQKKLAKKAIDMGVDCIIGHGPHIITNYEWINDKFILYSVGNFVFNHNCVEFVKRNIPPYSYVTKLYIDNETISLRIYPLDVYNPRTFWQPHPVTDEQFEEIIETYNIAKERIKQDEFGHYLEVKLFPYAEDKKWETINTKKQGEITKITNINTPVIFYGITDRLKRKFDKYVEITGEPTAISTKDAEMPNYQNELYLDKYEVISIDEIVQKYPNADIWVTYAKADNTANMLLKKFAPEKIHFFEADLEYRNGCNELGHTVWFNGKFLPCSNSNYESSNSNYNSINENINNWKKNTIQILNDINSKNSNNHCKNCPKLKYSFWHKTIKPDTIILFDTVDNMLKNNDYEIYQMLKQLSEIQEYNTSTFSVKIYTPMFCVNKYCNDIMNIFRSTKWSLSFFTNHQQENNNRIQDINNITNLRIIEAYNNKMALSWFSTQNVDGWDIFINGKFYYNVKQPLEHIAIFDYSEDEIFIKGYKIKKGEKVYITESAPTHVYNSRTFTPKSYKLSVIVPAYNAEDYISRTILTLLASTIDDIEIIIVNDESTDNTEEIIKWYKNKYPNFIYYYNKKNTGISDTRNKGIELARGKYITFMDNDDMIRPNAYEEMFCAIELANTDIVISPYYKIEENFEYNLRQVFSYKENTTIDSEVFLSKFYTSSDWSSGIWNKIYKSTLVKEHPLPIVQYEDVAWTPYIFSWAKNFCYINTPSYEWDRSIRPITYTNVLNKRDTNKRFKDRFEAVKFYLDNGNQKYKTVLAYNMAVRLYKQGHKLDKGKELYYDAIRGIKHLLTSNQYLINDKKYGGNILKLLSE